MRAATQKTVVVHQPGSPDKVLAIFRWDGKKVACDWRDESYRREVASRGIPAMPEGERRKPADGEAFWRALDDAYRNASFVRVVADRVA